MSKLFPNRKVFGLFGQTGSGRSTLVRSMGASVRVGNRTIGIAASIGGLKSIQASRFAPPPPPSDDPDYAEPPESWNSVISYESDLSVISKAAPPSTKSIVIPYFPGPAAAIRAAGDSPTWESLRPYFTSHLQVLNDWCTYAYGSVQSMCVGAIVFDLHPMDFVAQARCAADAMTKLIGSPMDPETERIYNLIGKMAKTNTDNLFDGCICVYPWAGAETYKRRFGVPEEYATPEYVGENYYRGITSDVFFATVPPSASQIPDRVAICVNAIKEKL